MEIAVTRISLQSRDEPPGWPDLPVEGGGYVLGLRLARREVIRVGRLGTFAFAAGWYAYAGSALGGLRARLGRHLRPAKALRWHVDYLLARAEPCEVWLAVWPERLECRWAQLLADLPGAAIPVRRFGATDCRCPAHLIYRSSAPPQDVVTGLLATACRDPLRRPPNCGKLGPARRPGGEGKELSQA